MEDNIKEITSDNYVIEELKCRCTVCGFEFFEYMPLNYELVCFIDELGEKYFLPTYGEYGYLDLLEKIVKNWTPDKEITSRVVKSFEERLEKITPIKVSLFQKVKCPICSKDDVIVIDRTPIKDYPVNWLKIDTI